jgi:diphthamide synthase subunit DPH2
LFNNKSKVFVNEFVKDKFDNSISFYLNQEIGTILSIKEKENRKEIAKLLFEIRNELEFLTN